MVARVASLLCILVLLAPSAALAQGGGAFQPIPQAPPQQPTTVAPTQGNDDEEGLSSTQQLLIVLSALLLMGGIAWAIMRDARNAAPADTRSAPLAAGEAPRPRGSQRPASVRHRDNRAKAKAARQARKKARKR